MSDTARDLLDEYEQRQTALEKTRDSLLNMFVDLILARILSEAGDRRGADFDHWILRKVPFGEARVWEFPEWERARISKERPGSDEAELVATVLNDCSTATIQCAVLKRLHERVGSEYALGGGLNEVVRRRADDEPFDLWRTKSTQA